MNREFFRKVLIAILATILMIPGFQSMVLVSAAENRVIDRDLQVAYCDVLGQETSIAAHMEDPYTDFAGEIPKGSSYTYRYRFTLDQVSYVNFRINSNVSDWNFSGSCSVYLGRTANDMTYPIATDKWVNGKAPINYTTALASGTYYLSIVTTNKEVGNYGLPMQNRYLSVGIQAQRLQRTGGVSGRTKLDAIPALSGQVSVGVIDGISSNASFGVCTPVQWFKLSVNGKFKMDTTVNVSRPLGLDDTLGVTAKLYDAAGALIMNNKSNNSNSVTLVSKELAAGDYFMEVSYPRFCEIIVLPNVTITQVIQLPKPASVRAIAGKKKVTLQWKKCNGASGYDVYRSNRKSGGFKKVASVRKNKYVDRKGIKSKKVYYYKVRAKSPLATASKYSKIIKVKVK